MILCYTVTSTICWQRCGWMGWVLVLSWVAHFYQRLLKAHDTVETAKVARGPPTLGSPIPPGHCSASLPNSAFGKGCIIAFWCQHIFFLITIYKTKIQGLKITHWLVHSKSVVLTVNPKNYHFGSLETVAFIRSAAFSTTSVIIQTSRYWLRNFRQQVFR